MEMTEETKAKLMSRYNFKYSEIARALGVSREAVHKWIYRENGLPIRRAKQIEVLTDGDIQFWELLK